MRIKDLGRWIPTDFIAHITLLFRAIKVVNTTAESKTSLRGFAMSNSLPCTRQKVGRVGRFRCSSQRHQVGLAMAVEEALAFSFARITPAEWLGDFELVI